MATDPGLSALERMLAKDAERMLRRLERRPLLARMPREFRPVMHWNPIAGRWQDTGRVRCRRSTVPKTIKFRRGDISPRTSAYHKGLIPNGCATYGESVSFDTEGELREYMTGHPPDGEIHE